MKNEQVYWIFTVTVDHPEKLAQLIPKLVSATAQEPGALQFDCHVSGDNKTVQFFERYVDSRAALRHQAESFAPYSAEFFAAATLTEWVIYGSPSDDFKKANEQFKPIYMRSIDGFVR